MSLFVEESSGEQNIFLGFYSPTRMTTTGKASIDSLFKKVSINNVDYPLTARPLSSANINVYFLQSPLNSLQTSTLKGLSTWSVNFKDSSDNIISKRTVDKKFKTKVRNLPSNELTASNTLPTISSASNNQVEVKSPSSTTDETRGLYYKQMFHNKLKRS